MDIKATLVKKYGPFPGYVWAGIAGVGIILAHNVLGIGKSKTTATPGTPASGVNTTTYFGNPGRPGPPGAAGPPGPAGPPAVLPPPVSPGSAAPPKPSPQHRIHVVQHGDTLWGIASTYLGSGARWPEIWALSHFRSGNPNLIYPGEIAVLPLDATGGPGLGGPKSIGSRSKSMWHNGGAHPGLRRDPAFPQYVRAVGGPRGHVAEVHRVAAAAGVHPARLLALNPFHTGRIRIA